MTTDIVLVYEMLSKYLGCHVLSFNTIDNGKHWRYPCKRDLIFVLYLQILHKIFVLLVSYFQIYLILKTKITIFYIEAISKHHY